MFIYPKFLQSESEYLESEKFWRVMWDEISPGREWSTPWLRTSFANGQEFRSGNPIFSARAVSQGRALKVIQVAPEDGLYPITAWVKAMEDENELSFDCLVINCMLSEETASAARNLMERWIEFQGIPAEFDPTP